MFHLQKREFTSIVNDSHIGSEIVQVREDVVDSEALLKDDQIYLKDVDESPNVTHSAGLGGAPPPPSSAW